MLNFTITYSFFLLEIKNDLLSINSSHLRNQRYYERFRVDLIARQRDSKKRKKEHQIQLNLSDGLPDSNEEDDYSGMVLFFL